jgi:hypothetical protein
VIEMDDRKMTLEGRADIEAPRLTDVQVDAILARLQAILA